MLDSIFQFTGNTIRIGPIALTFSVSGVIEIILFAIFCYYIILWFKRTKAWSLLKGASVLLAFYLLSLLLGLNDIVYLFDNLVGSLVIAVIIILQPELRRALEQLGDRSIFARLLPASSPISDSVLNIESIDAVTRALSSLGRKKIGALIVVERSIVLNEFIETGIALDARISSALIEQIFEHNTPLHDGAVIIRDNRIVAATCYLPLSHNDAISKELGTRHRAGLGISEVSDSITLISSEETGTLSIAMDGKLYRNMKPDEIRDILSGSGTERIPDRKDSILTRRLRSWRKKKDRKNGGEVQS